VPCGRGLIFVNFYNELQYFHAHILTTIFAKCVIVFEVKCKSIAQCVTAYLCSGIKRGKREGAVKAGGLQQVEKQMMKALLRRNWQGAGGFKKQIKALV